MVAQPILNSDEVSTYYLNLQTRFTAWANRQEDIRAAIVVGSRARSNHLPDEWSDLDIMVYARQPDGYLTDHSWLPEIGEVWIAVPSRTAGNDPEILVTFAGGFNVDFVFNPIAQLEKIAQDGGIPAGHWRGARVILDKDRVAEKTLPGDKDPPFSSPPDQDSFNWILNAFWYTASYLAKQLRRGDLVMVKQRDADVKRCLIQMMEWHARSAHPETDTWHMGRYMDEWADPRALPIFQSTYAHFDQAESWQTLLTSIELFKWLSKETAANLRLSYPENLEQHSHHLVMELHQGAHLTPPK